VAAVLSLLMFSAAVSSSGPVYRYNVPLVLLRTGQSVQYEVAQSATLCLSRKNTIVHRPGKVSDVFNLVRTTRAQRLVVFVPGFATAAPLGVPTAYRMARLFGSQDLLLYADWGSGGKQYEYVADSKAARTNAPALARFLEGLHRSLPRMEIDVFAHSLGARVLALAMAQIQLPSNGSAVIRNVVLAAPDMSLNDYLRAIIRKPEPVERVTLYVSRHDHALLLSSLVHWHHRLGRITSWRHAIARTDVVDASQASHGLDGHGYAINEPDLIRDVALTLHGARVPHASWTRLKKGSVTWTYVGPTGNPTRGCN